MKRYSVKEISTLSGVSIRTLHYYDKIDLLKPLDRTEAGYRYYGEKELLRLQQILFYKELDFPLKDIREILDDPDFDLIEALNSHKSALQARKKRITSLLITINHTINQLKNGEIMSNPEELYEGLPKEVGTTYRQEAIDAYGRDAVEQSEQELLKLGKTGYKKLQQELEQVNQDLFGLQQEAPDSETVQGLIARHYAIIRAFWGKTNSTDKQAEAYAGLGQLYVDDERFTQMNGQPQPAYARFLKQAMGHYAETQLAE